MLLILLMGSGSLFAQEAVAESAGSGILDWAFQNIVFIMGFLVAVGAVMSILYLNNKLLEIQKIRLLEEHGLEVLEEVKLLDKEPWWKRMYDKSWNLVPMEKEKDILFDHEYDGIRELDNVLPPWWVALFWGCIIYGFGYLAYYHVFDYGESQAEEYETEMEYATAQVEAYLAKQADFVDENNVEVVTDENRLALGETLYMGNCAACHGIAGEGGIGPNMTDKYWIQGGSISDIFKTIKYGVPEKGMIAWKSQLRPSDIQNLASYILTLQGTDPPNAKEPQGELYEGGSEEIGMK